MTLLNEERQLIKATAAQFTDDVVLPAANKFDPVKGKIPRAWLFWYQNAGRVWRKWSGLF